MSPPPFSAVRVSAVCLPVDVLWSIAFHANISLVTANRLSASLSFHLTPGLWKWKLMTHKDCSGTGSLDSRENITVVFPERAINTLYWLVAWLSFIALCVYASFCLSPNQAYLYKGYSCKLKCCCSKGHMPSIQKVYWLSSWHKTKASVLCTKALRDCTHDGK